MSCLCPCCDSVLCGLWGATEECGGYLTSPVSAGSYPSPPLLIGPHCLLSLLVAVSGCLFRAAPIDVVIVNLYPFVKTVTAAGGTPFDKGVENIDIGGPGMIRAAAKVRSPTPRPDV